MKKRLLLLLCLLLTLALFAGCKREATNQTEDGAETEADVSVSSSDDAPIVSEAEDEPDYLNYKRLHTGNFTLEDMMRAEGAAPTFSVAQSDGTLCCYNNCEIFGLQFGQVQYYFHEDRITVTGNYSCAESETDEQAIAKIRTAMTERYGEPSVAVTSSGDEIYNWYDGTANYAYCNVIVPGSIQLTFCFVEQG